MISAFQIQCLKLPPLFLFDSLKLYAKFQTAIANLAMLTFEGQSLERQRNIELNVLLKIPACRSSFTLVLQTTIINMPLPPVNISIDLLKLAEESQCCLVFQTDMGQVQIEASLIQQIYLPKKETFIKNSRSCILQNNVGEKETFANSCSVINEHEKKMKENFEETEERDKDRKSVLRKCFSSRRKFNNRPQKQCLSRSEYLKLQFDQSWVQKFMDCSVKTTKP